MHNRPGGHVDDLLEPLHEDLLTFNDPEPGWEWYPTPGGYVEAPQECLLFGGPLSAPLPTPMRITRKVSGPLACPSGGIKLELTWDEKDTWLENDIANKIHNSVNSVSWSYEDDFPVQQSWRESDKTGHRDWDRSATVPSFCPPIKSKTATTRMSKQTRETLEE
ncbi:hypothetical protein C0995_006137 [Termitomyces sp. Mi166|nr:hypothetical protein C0995_006137 [Termitomyces sp. Mi166\